MQVIDNLPRHMCMTALAQPCVNVVWCLGEFAMEGKWGSNAVCTIYPSFHAEVPPYACPACHTAASAQSVGDLIQLRLHGRHDQCGNFSFGPCVPVGVMGMWVHGTHQVGLCRLHPTHAR